MELLSLISMLIDGVTITNEVFSQAALTSAQQIMFNFRRHLQFRETAVAIYTTLKLYVFTRSRTLIDCFHHLGMCISYHRLLNITKNISEAVLEQYDRDGVFLPNNLKTDTFTVIPKDNLDINAKSSEASQHFHGTCMSVLQFPKAVELTPVPPIQFDSTTSTFKKVGHLPESYASV